MNPTNEPVQAVVRQALEEAKAIGLSVEYERIAFQELLRAALARHAAQHPNTDKGAGDDANSPSARLAARWGIEPAVIDNLFVFRDSELLIEVPRQRLDHSKSGATKQLAMLVCSARQVGLDEAQTLAHAIRATCEEFGVYDSANFAATLRELTGLLRVIGPGRQKAYQITRPGLERAKEIALSLLG